MLCPVHHNWLGVAGAVFLVLEITEVAETTDNHGDTETRRMRVAALSAAGSRVARKHKLDQNRVLVFLGAP